MSCEGCFCFVKEMIVLVVVSFVFHFFLEGIWSGVFLLFWGFFVCGGFNFFFVFCLCWYCLVWFDFVAFCFAGCLVWGVGFFGWWVVFFLVCGF